MQRKISLSQQIICWQTLAHLAHARIPLYQSLEITKDAVGSKQLKSLLSQIQSDLVSGQTLSQSLIHNKGLGSQFNTQMVALGEKTGDYARAFSLIAQQLAWQQSWQQLVQQSLRYPVILLILLSVLLVIIILLVLPGLMDQLIMLGIRDVPAATQILIAIGRYPIEILGGIGVGGSIILGWRSYRYHKVLKPWRYGVPRLGSILYRLQMTQFFYALGVMLTARVDVLASLYHASQTPTCRWLRLKLQETEQHLVAGQSLSAALQDILPKGSPTASLIIVGEATGTLGELLVSSCEAEQVQLQAHLKSWLDLLQPGLVVVMGLVMVWVVLAVLLPLYQSLGTFHG